MSDPEIVTVAVVVGASVAFLIRRVWAASQGEKGSCKSCGDVCGCAIKDAIKDRRP